MVFFNTREDVYNSLEIDINATVATLKDILNDRESIIKLFNYCIKYGTILYTKRYSKKISFLCALKMNEVLKDRDAVKLIFDKGKYPEINKYISKIDKNSNYIVLVGVNKNFRKRNIAKKLVRTYLHYYNKVII